MTPEQMRALAMALTGCAGNDQNAVRAGLLNESATALRAAADQLEAVQAWADHAESLAQGDSPYYPDLYNILESNNNGKH